MALGSKKMPISKFPSYDMAVMLAAVPATGPMMMIVSTLAPAQYSVNGAPRRLDVAKSM